MKWLKQKALSTLVEFEDFMNEFEEALVKAFLRFEYRIVACICNRIALFYKKLEAKALFDHSKMAGKYHNRFSVWYQRANYFDMEARHES